ncbi:MAG TPA: hypothetical protein VFA74_10215 [Terriglobales bacterium]|nr:hypothetical protein [Terriglobales bacterium]
MRRDSSWFALLAFCLIATLIIAIGFATLFAGAALAFTEGAQGDNEPVAGTEPAINAYQSGQNGKSESHEASAAKIYNGMITDSHCMGRHVRYPDKSSAECARMCARTGSAYVLIDGDKKYTLHGGDMALDRAAAQRATVAGVLQGDTIRVTSAGVQ